MISLDDEELGIIMVLAEPLHPTRGGQFLQAVVEEASKHVELGPGLLNRIGRALKKRFVGAMPRLAEPAGATRQTARRR
jgi:hypothetical protein